MNRVFSRTSACLGAAAVVVSLILAPTAALADEPADGCMALVTANIEQTVATNTSGVSARVKPDQAESTRVELEKYVHYQASKPVGCNGDSWRKIMASGLSVGEYVLAAAVSPVDRFAGIEFDSWIALAPGVDWAAIGSEPSSERRLEPIMEAGVFAASSKTIAGDESMRYADGGYYAIKLSDGTRGFVEAAKVQQVAKDFKPGTEPTTSEVSTGPNSEATPPSQAKTPNTSESTAPAFLPALIIGLAAIGGIGALIIRRKKRKTTTDMENQK